MKKLLIVAIALLGIAGEAHTAPIFGTVQISTTTSITPTLQTGAFNTSSGTVRTLEAVTENVNFLTVRSTASFAGVTGSTISYSSATFTNVSVTGTATIGTGNISTLTASAGTATLSTASITGISGSTITYSSATFTGAHVTGATTVDGNVTAGSLTTTGTSSLTGAVTLGGSNNGITLSSTTTAGSTKLYTAGTFSVVSDSMNLTGVFKVQNSSTNSCGYMIGSAVGYAKYTSVTSSATTVTNFVPTLLTGAITPKCASDIIRASVTGCIQGTNPAAGDVAATLFRGSTDLSPDSSHALCVMGDGGVSVQLNVPCGFTIYDLPATVNSTTYTVKMRYETGSGTLTWGNNCGQYLLLEDIAQ